MHFKLRDHHGRDNMVVLTTTRAINATKVVSSNHDHDELYSIKHYVIKFISESMVFSVYSGVLHQ